MWEAGLDEWGQNVQGKPTEEVFKKGCIHFPRCCGKFLVKDGGKEELILAHSSGHRDDGEVMDPGHWGS